MLPKGPKISPGIGWPHTGIIVSIALLLRLSQLSPQMWVSLRTRTSYPEFLTAGSICSRRFHGNQAGVFSPPGSAKVLENSRSPPLYKGKRGQISIQGLIFPSFLLTQFSSTRAPSGVEQGTSFP